jgi:hypothetical protein
MSKHLLILICLACAAFSLDGFAGAGRTSAAVPSTTTYVYTGSEQTFPVPPNVTGIDVIMYGGPGAPCCGGALFPQGGDPGFVEADIPVPAGVSTLYVEVGGGGTAGAGGWNGGGAGPAGGGGASDIRTVSCGACTNGGSTASLNSRLVVAGGGGGASAAQAGGNAGYTVSTQCSLCGAQATPVLNAGGAAATQSAVTAYCQGKGDMDGEPGSDGFLGVGGAAATFFLTGPVDGGGGGGWYGGGGGGQCYGSGAVATARAGAGGGGSTGVPNGLNVVIATAASISAGQVGIATPVPTPSTTPTVSGGVEVGDALSESHAQWSSAELPVSGYSYRWERCNTSGASCTPIGGAIGPTYTLVHADDGHTIRVQETAVNFFGSSAAPATSTATAVVGEPPLSTAAPTVTGIPTEGATLLEKHAAWTDAPLTGYHVQWLRCGELSCSPIGGATAYSYTLGAADIGSTIKVQETATNSFGTSAAATSAATPTVQATKFELLGPPKAQARRVSFMLSCDAAAGAVCRGSAQVTTLERRVRGKVVALLERPKKHSKTALLGSKGIMLAAGAQEKIVVAINLRGAQLLAHFPRIPATLTITLLNTNPPAKLVARTTIRRRR